MTVGLIIFISSLPEASNANDLTQISGRFGSQFSSSVKNVICGDDVKYCAGGSYVSRDPLKACQFDCSSVVSAPVSGIILCPQDVKQCPDNSFVIRDPNKNCQFKACSRLSPDSSSAQ